MSADRARITYYPQRKYREIVSQQGRVLVEADSNEGQRIVTEETRREALDFVGACGTPDNGYAVVPLGTDFQITRGTMYVGGLRVTLEADAFYTKQSDWLDTDAIPPWGDGLWRSPASFQKTNLEATLVLREQEITAVEDPALRDVALGGPDSGARTRLLQRVVAVDTQSTTCAGAVAGAEKFWSGHGLVYDPATAELKPRARLQVTPVIDASAPSPCDPPSASGYLGADNQMIRVQVTALDKTTNAGTLLWSYYNAATLYRCTVQTASTLKLATRPVSAEYQPRSGQVVQVLSRAAALGEGAFAAALTGHFARLTVPYAPDTQAVTLPAAMPQPPYANGSSVYLRLWEDQVNFTVGTPVVLAGTGLQVTLTKSSVGPLHIGDYWCIAARPSTPNAVYPERFLTAPQPPDGPRLWACPLALLQGDGKQLTVLDDCRPPFENLVELTARKCACTVCVSPHAHLSGAPSLQMAIDQVIKTGGGTICLEAGAYALKEPLRIQKARSLRIVGKGRASELQADLTVLEVADSTDVGLESFSVVCRGSAKSEDSAVLLHSSTNLRVEHLEINVEKSGAAVGLSGALAGVLIRDNDVTAPVGIVNVGDPKVATGLMHLRVEDNRFVCGAIAVRLANGSVHQVTRIARNHVDNCGVAGFELTGATVPGFGVEIIGNVLQVVGDGIVAGVDGLRIVDNDLKSAGKERHGIRLTRGMTDESLDDAQVVGNRILGFAFGIGIAAKVQLGSVVIAHNQIANAQTGLLVEGSPVDSLTINDNQIKTIRDAAIHVESTKGRVAACGNQLEILDGSPGVMIRCRGGDCVYADNHSHHLKAPKEGVVLSAKTVIATSNRIVGKVPLLLETGSKAPLCTVLGNVTGAQIIVDGATLAPPSPFAPLNLQNVV